MLRSENNSFIYYTPHRFANVWGSKNRKPDVKLIHRYELNCVLRESAVAISNTDQHLVEYANYYIIYVRNKEIVTHEFKAPHI